ncbi:MAG: thiol-disulfide oxidoreductase DCC family protein [Halobacteriaceae archaeon]
MAPPRLVYDDDCGFCTRGVRFFARHGDFELVGFSALSPDQRARLPTEYERCMHLLTDDAVYSCGRAAEECLARLDGVPATLFVLARAVPGYERLRDGAYRYVADHRSLLGRLSRRL